VREALASWQEQEYLAFKIKAEDGACYVLRYHRADDAWEVARI
jgi:hypothetical protein